MSNAPSVGRGRLPVQNRDRRAALMALALLLVVAGALGAALVVYRTGQKVDVLVAAHEIKPGEKVSGSDFSVSRVTADADSVVRASDESNFLGTYATTDIPAGTLVNRLMFQAGSVIPADGVLVGVNLAANQQPSSGISAGDVVRAYVINKSSDSLTPGQALVDAARVTDVSAASSSSGNSTTVTLLVTSSAAPALIAAATQGAVAVAELPKSTKPPIDLVTKS